MPNGDVVGVGTTSSPAGGDVSQPLMAGFSIYSMWVVRTDANGTKLWDRRLYSLQGMVAAEAFATPDGGIILVGSMNGGIGGDVTQPDITNNPLGSSGQDVWVVKLNAAGTKLWDRRYGGGGNETVQTAIATRDGGLVVVSTTDSGADGNISQPSRGGFDTWTLRLSPTGTVLWERRLGGSRDEAFYGVTETADGGFALLGTTQSGISGDITTAPRSQAPPATFPQDAWLVKLDRNGVKRWERRFGTPAGSYGLGLVQTPDRGYLLALLDNSGGANISLPNIGVDKTQPSIGGDDAWVVRTDSLGGVVWDRVYGGLADDGLKGIMPLPDNGFLLSGISRSGTSGTHSQPNRGGYDGWLVRINASGGVLWDKNLGGPADESVARTARFSNGSFVVGMTSNSGAGGDKTQPSRGSTDYWLVRLGPEVLAAATPSWAGALALYPNPSPGPCQLALPARVGSASSAQVLVFDALGRRVWAGSAPLLAQASSLALPLANLASGVYVVRVAIGSEQATLRLTVAP